MCFFFEFLLFLSRRYSNLGKDGIRPTFSGTEHSSNQLMVLLFITSRFDQVMRVGKVGIDAAKDLPYKVQ